MAVMIIVGLIGIGLIVLAFFLAAPRIACGVVGGLLLLFGGGCVALASNHGARISDGVFMVGLLPAVVGGGMLIYALLASFFQDPSEKKDDDA